MSKAAKRKAPKDFNQEQDEEMTNIGSNKNIQSTSNEKIRILANYSNEDTELNQTSLRSGIIEKVCFKNFKCHSYLDIKFHPYINFITGRNGSGKSSIMDGIILCLGGKALSTGRKVGSKTFIKNELEKTELTVTIRNKGEDAYKPDLYGSKIIIERVIFKNGRSNYRILNENNNLVSNRKQELDNIIEQFNLQVENPICFLNQETSKTLLNIFDRSKMYQLFMNASQLESARILLERIELERQHSLNLIAERETSLEKLRNEVREWREKYKKCQSVENLQKKLVLLMNEYSWSEVLNLENILEKLDKEKKYLENSKKNNQEKLNEAQESFKKTDQEYRKFKSNLNESTLHIKNLNLNSEDRHTQFKKALADYRQSESNLKKLKLQIEKRTLEKEQIREKIDEFMADTDSEYQKNIKNINRIKDELQNLDIQENLKDVDDKNLQSDLYGIKKELNQKEFEVEDLLNSIGSLQFEIQNLCNARNNQIYRFGHFMPNLMSDIKMKFEKGKFKEMPKGPIGMSIQSKNNKWSLAIERCIGSLLTAFICGSYQDEQMLHEIFLKHIPLVHQRPRVIVCDFTVQLYDVSKYRIENLEHPTVYDMLTIKDPIISNTLVDQRKIESILLLPDRKTGRNLMEKNTIPNCIEAFLLNGDQLLSRPSFRVYGCYSKNAKYLIEDHDINIQSKELEISNNHKNIDLIKTEIASLKEKEDQVLKKRAKIDEELQLLKKDRVRTINELKDAEIQVKLSKPTDLEIFEEENQNLEKVIDNLINQIELTKKISSEKNEIYEKAKKDYDNIQIKINETWQNIEQLKESFNQLENESSASQKTISYYEKLLKELTSKENKLNKEISLTKENHQSYLNVALELSPRIQTKKTPQSIDKEILLIEEQIQKSENMKDSEMITRKYKETSKKYKQIESCIKKNKVFLKKLKLALHSREKAKNLFTESKALRCAIEFNNYMKCRNFNGQLKFDHDLQQLEIAVSSLKAKVNNQKHDLKSLSGGERSFSIVAFLLSLWSIVETPILSLDEFDVFMDQLNRSFALDLIVAAAKDKLKGQYIFLTPHDIGSIKPDEFIKSFKMDDPER